MKIYLARRSAGLYGGGFKGNLRYFDQIIQTELDQTNFLSSFEEIWLTLSYPPMYVLPGVVGIEKDFKKFYDTLPLIKFNRKYKKIDIELKAPQFSEHFEKTEKDKYENTFDIEHEYKNISETELAKILIDKYLEAGEMINAKLKKEDIFELEIFKNVLYLLRGRISAEYLKSASTKKTDEIKTKEIVRAIELREQRKQLSNTKNKRIRDLRVYYVNLPKGALYPFDYQYAEIFKNLLRKKELMCPTYNHLYVQVGKTMDECLMNSVALEDWYVNGLSVINYDDYLKQTDNGKEQIVFDTIVNGLKDIAEIDKLDLSIVNNIIEEVNKKGLDTELEYLSTENKNHKLVISYLSRSMEEQCPIYLEITEKTSNKNKKIQIGLADNYQIYYWLQKVTMTNTLIKIKSSDSIAADVYLKDKVRSMEFNIKSLLNG
jgi:hypothetical protein